MQSIVREIAYVQKENEIRKRQISTPNTASPTKVPSALLQNKSVFDSFDENMTGSESFNSIKDGAVHRIVKKIREAARARPAPTDARDKIRQSLKDDATLRKRQKPEYMNNLESFVQTQSF